jgi:hypothetical protein
LRRVAAVKTCVELNRWGGRSAWSFISDFSGCFSIYRGAGRAGQAENNLILGKYQAEKLSSAACRQGKKWGKMTVSGI